MELLFTAYSRTKLILCLALLGLLCNACGTSTPSSYSEWKHPRITTIKKEIAEVIPANEADIIIKHNLLDLVAELPDDASDCHPASIKKGDTFKRNNNFTPILNEANVDYWESLLKHPDAAKQEIAYTVAKNVESRIFSLRNTISATGLNVKRLDMASAAPIPLTKNSMRTAATYPDSVGQGGPFVPAETFNPSDDDIKRILDHLITLDHIHEALPLGIPMPDGRVTSGYGFRRDPINRRTASHSGIDFQGQGSPPIYSTAAGKVIYSGLHGEYGNMVIIDHGMNLTTRYAHLSKRTVREGQTVGTGQLVGYQGRTGRVTGSHLHYEVRLNDVPLNPAKFLKAGKQFCSIN